MVKVKVEGREVEEMEFHFAGEDGNYMWIRFRFKDGKTQDTYVFKGSL